MVRMARQESGEGGTKEEKEKWRRSADGEAGKRRRAWDGVKEKRFFVKKDKCTCIYKK